MPSAAMHGAVARSRSLGAALTAASLLVAAGISAQDRPTTTPTWDVVSVKRMPDGSNLRRLDWTPGRFVGRGLPFGALVNIAYGGGTPVRLEGGPSAIRAAEWDVEGTFTPALIPNAGQRAELLRHLLETRFHLALRRETRNGDIYALVVARRDATLGAGMQPSTLPCDGAGRAPLVPPAVPPPGRRPACGLIMSSVNSLVLGGDTTLDPLTRTLALLAGRPVVDRTGLTGKYDIVLSVSMSAIRQSPGTDAPTEPPDTPSVFTALPEQLGLRLQPEKAPLEYFVIERLDEPDQN